MMLVSDEYSEALGNGAGTSSATNGKWTAHMSSSVNILMP
jgi:hypothetical protein